MTVTSNL
jgi:hypothetical protein